MSTNRLSTKKRISAKVILDSISPEGVRLLTIHTHEPRFILAEINTHRVMSRNTRSTRAVPTSKLIKEVRENPYTPIRYESNKSGMQAGKALPEHTAAMCEKIWRESAASAANRAESLFDLGLHKQWAGRVLEPYMWADTLLTSTDWTNFLGLRVHPDAQPEFDCLAEKIYEAIEASTPKEKAFGQWHLPYIDELDLDKVFEYTHEKWSGHVGSMSDLLIKTMYNIRLLSAARCARISYAPFEGSNSVAAELERAKKLQGPPVHASPFEHQATPDKLVNGTISDETGDKDVVSWLNPNLHGNFSGWVQGRKLMVGENITQFGHLDERREA